MTFIPKGKVDNFLEQLTESSIESSSGSKRYSNGLETVLPSKKGIPEEGIYKDLNFNPEKFKNLLFFDYLRYLDAKRKDDETPLRYREERRPLITVYQSPIYYFIKDLGRKKAKEVLAKAKNDRVREDAEKFLEICLRPERVFTEEEYRRYHEELVLKDLGIPYTFRGRPIIDQSAFLTKVQE
ncbi:hypothetical protein HZA97_08860 [Candidatus Woesearchaeota archaeon]|nr:hypothetical protein [Candidatus Woesearchaeota archaeon]